MTQTTVAQVAVTLGRRGAERWRGGHPWIYVADVERVPEPLDGGEIVRVLDGRGRLLGQAFFSRHSLIALRRLTFDAASVDRDFFRRRIEQAAKLRTSSYPQREAYRLVHGEADLLPGLVVDRYLDHLSVQFLHAATDRRAGMFVELLVEVFRPRTVVNRSDAAVRRLEGLEPERGVLYGTWDGAVVCREGDVEFEVDLLDGQKTGTFLDQQDNHLMAGGYGTGESLDCFSYHGGFALQLARRARRVTAVEISEPACARILANAARNGMSNVEVVAANAFDFLREAEKRGQRYDTIVLDPPSFARAKSAVPAALRGYKEINLRAMRLLAPGGTLITASCTYHVGEERFEALLGEAAGDAGRQAQIIDKRGAGRDHPVLAGLGETRYLKCFVLRVF